jgi:hypothetical protein
MDLNYLLSERGIDTQRSRVLVLRHTPPEQELRRVLPWLASAKPDVFNAYQRAQGAVVEQKLIQATYLASCIGHKAKAALFVGLYAVNGHQPITYTEFWEIAENQELKKLGMEVGAEANYRVGALWFDLTLTDVCADWKGKLIIDWPPPDISWARWANDNEFKVRAILEESALDKGMPPWDELCLTWAELHNLPQSWVGALTQWRGVYFILDGADGKGYIGSAYGQDNLYGRWSDYAASGDCGNKLLRKRAPDKFLFSILELVSPTEKPEDVIRLESTWKDRLHTLEFGLNAN